MKMKKVLSIAFVVFVISLSACTSSNTNAAGSETMAVHEIVQSAVSTLSVAESMSTVTQPVVEDPWIAARNSSDSADTTQSVIQPDFSSEITFFEASKVTAAIDIDYFNSNGVKVGRGLFFVYPEKDDFEINFRIRLKNKDRLKYILEATPYILQDVNYYKLTYDATEEYPYEYQFLAYTWHLKSFPSLDSIKQWAKAWKNGEYAQPFFELSSSADKYFKEIGADSQVPASERYAAYAAKFSDEDPYFIDKYTGIKYQFGINEAIFNDDKTTVGIPYLRVCDLIDQQDLYCDLYYSYNDSKFEFIPEEWTQDSLSLDVSGILQDEITEGESIYGYIVIPYNGSGTYCFKGKHNDSVKFKIYSSEMDLTSMEQCVQDYMTVNPSAIVDYNTLLSTASAMCDTSTSAKAKNKLYTVADMTALRNYYLFVQSYTDKEIWVQLAASPYYMWRVDANTAYLYHISDTNGDPSYMLIGDTAWVAIAKSLYSDSTSIDNKGGAVAFLQWYNSKCGTDVKFTAVS